MLYKPVRTCTSCTRKNGVQVQGDQSMTMKFVCALLMAFALIPSALSARSSNTIGPPGDSFAMDKCGTLPPEHRPMGWGYNCNEFYGPTYYYPSYHNYYEGLSPTYYPFYHPRLWPNYKPEGVHVGRTLFGPTREVYHWDDYDD